MSTIPASASVSVTPSVLNAGGNALVLNGLALTQSTRVPMGTVLSFPTATSVGQYFGLTSVEYFGSQKYFNSYDGSMQKPGSLLFTQYNPEDVAAYLQSGKITNLGLAAIQAMSGSLTIVVDGYTHTAGSLSLAAATSYSAAAALIQTGLNASLPTAASVTGSIAASTASVTGAINGFILTVTTVSSGTIVPGAILSGTGVVSGTQIREQLTGTAGGIGTYGLFSSSSQIVASTTITAAYGTMTVTAVASGTLSTGQTISGAGVTASTMITGLGSGTGLTGTYYVSPSQTAASTAITAAATPLTVTFDSISGSFFVTSGVIGIASTMAFATGTLSASLLMTSATGGTLSQGANISTPSAFMTLLALDNQNWASFTHSFDPDFGDGPTQKLAFAQWTDAQNSRYAYFPTDNNITATQSTAAINSLGYLVGENGNNYSGTAVIYDPNAQYLAWFAMGFGASLDFGAHNGRATAAYKGHTGITAGVTNQTVRDNLIANGYNFYGANATANDRFLFFFPGSISGPFQWLDSYMAQIWLNSQIQLAEMQLLTNIPSIPYISSGYAMIAAAALQPAFEGVNFGAIRAGVPLSTVQKVAINNSAGAIITPIIFTQGWFFQVQAASPQVRQARQSPPCNFWYCDGQSVHRLAINSILVQ